MKPKDTEDERDHACIAGEEFEDEIFENADFVSSDMTNTKFVDCVFRGCTISTPKLSNTVLRAAFENSKIEGVNFFMAKREMLSLAFDSCMLRYVSFAELKLVETSFSNCVMEEVDFSDCDLTSADLTNVRFLNCRFQNTNLTKADLRGASGYTIDPIQNKIAKAHFDMPEAISLLSNFGAIIHT